MSQFATWSARSADPDIGRASAVWMEPTAPRTVLARPPDRVLEYLLGPGHQHGLLHRVLANPAVPNVVRSALAQRAQGAARSTISRYALYEQDDTALMVAVAATITPAELERRVSIRHDWSRPEREQAERARRAKIMRAFVGSTDTKCRALAAQAFPLGLGARHRYADGEVSATRLVADSAVAVRVALARNPHLRHLPETPAGHGVRRTLLEDPHPRVRTAARRAGIQVTSAYIEAAFAAAHGVGITRDPDALNLGDALDDPAPAVRATAVTTIRRHDGQRWTRVVTDPSPIVRRAAAANGWEAPRFVWTALSTDPDPTVRKTVATSRWAPAEIQRRLLSDAEPEVATAAHVRDPLSRSVHVPPALPPDGEVRLPVSLSTDPQVHLLDITATTLTLQQQHALARQVPIDHDVRADARTRAIRALAPTAQARWMVDRWIRWTSVFALPVAVPSLGGLNEQLAAPFAAATDSDTTADSLVAGALTLFDAALGLVATPDTTQGQIDRSVLTAPWTQVCVPTLHTADTVYGPATAAVRRCVTEAVRLPQDALDVVLTARIALDPTDWATARAEAVEAAAGPDEHVYAANFLFWDTVSLAEIATAQRPADPLLAEAMWGIAASTAYGDRLSRTTISVLTRPWLSVGLTVLS